MKVDLHTHSTVSDGVLTPTELVTRAHENNVELFALTDHDALNGVDEAAATAQQLGIKFLSGVEVSISWNKLELHVVALGIDVNNEQLQNGLEKSRDFRTWRGEEIARRLGKKRVADSLEGAKAFSNGVILSRTHFARFLVSRGYVKTMDHAFKKYLGAGKPAYVAGKWATLEDAVAWIKSAGGVAVLAHPARYNITMSKLRRFLTEFKECGGKGLEVVSGSNKQGEIEKMARLANEFELLASMGTDFHDPDHNWLELGALPPLPKSASPIWEFV